MVWTWIEDTSLLGDAADKAEQEKEAPPAGADITAFVTVQTRVKLYLSEVLSFLQIKLKDQSTSAFGNQ